MGSIKSYETNTGKRYIVRYRDPDHKSREKAGFRRKLDAENYLANIVVATSKGEYVDPQTAKTTIAEIGAEWITNQTHLKPSSARVLETAWRLHIEPAWGHRRVGQIRHSEVQSWFTKFAANDGKERSATVVIRAYGVLCGILDVAVLDRRISTNPARGIKMPRKGKKKRAYLTRPQVEILAKHSGEHSTLVYLLSYTGIRWGEAVGLRIGNLDVLRRRMNIEENAVILGGTVEVGTTKSHDNRSVPFPKFLTLPLAKACEGKTREQLVFGKGDAYQMRPGSGKGWFHRALLAAQAEDPTIPYLTPHDLRHTAASLAISSGANVKALQRMLGHASAAMTLDTYADLFDDDLDAVADLMDAARSETVVGVLWG
jgi:integrase